MLRRLLREGRRFPSTVRVSMLVAALGVMAGSSAAQSAETGPSLDGLKRLDLPREITRASDVRWLADGEIVLGVIGSGMQAWRLVESGAELRVALEDTAPEVLEIGGRAVVNRNTFERDYGRLGSSPQGLALADLFGGVLLANDSGIDGPVDIKFVGDLDRRGALTAAVGLMLRDADGWAPATSAYHWRPAPRWRAEGSRRRPSIHHVALRSSQRAAGFNRQRPVSLGPGRQRAQEPAVQPRGRAGVPGGSVRDLVVAAVPPPSGRVCWDLVHARVDDLRTVARQPCVVESEFADTRLRADLLEPATKSSGAIGAR